MKKSGFDSLPLAAAVCSALVPAAAYAGTEASPSAGRLEEIVITASRSRQRLLDSAATFSVVNSQDLARSTGYSLAELLRDVPSVQVTDSGQPGLARVRIRGEEARRSAVLINSQEVTDHFEVGVPLTLHPSMLQRIEVMRGSGAVLYGSRALSGVVNYITRKGGTRPLQMTVSGGYDGATSGYSGFASLYGNVSGTEYRLALAQSDHEERSTPAGEVENTRFDNDSLYAFVGRSFGDHRLEYIYDRYESSSEIYVEPEIRTTFPLTDFYLESPQRDREKHSVFYSWDADNAWLQSLSANGYLQDSKRHFYTSTETVWYQRDIDTFNDLDTSGALLQLNLQPLGNHRLIGGLQYLLDEVDQLRHVDTLAWAPQAVTGIEEITDRAEIETWAWFLQDQWSITDTVQMTAGLRQYFVEGELTATDRDSLEPGKLDEDNELIGALGLVWSLGEDMSLRANVAEGYVYPSLAQLATGAYAGSRFVNPDPELSPETSINYDLGFRLQRGDLMLDATAFYTESDEYIHHVPCTAADSCPGSRDRRYVNIGDSRAHGIEIAFSQANVLDVFEPYAAVTWMKRRNEYAEFSTWDSGIPEWSGRVGARWQYTPDARWAIWNDTYVRGETGSDLKEPGTTRDILEDKSGWVTVNAAFGLDFGAQPQFQFILELINLTDKEYIAATENLYGAERSLALKMNMSW